MKKFIALGVAVLLLFAPVFIMAGEKEELLLKKEVLTERRDKLVTQNQLIQMHFQVNQNELSAVEAKIKKLEEKEAEERKDKTKKPEEK